MARRALQTLPDPEQLLIEYVAYLRSHRGLSAKYCCRHHDALCEFLVYIAGRNLSLREVKVVDLDGFFQSVMKRGGSKWHLCMRGTSLRGFFSFLFAEGWLEEDLSAFVETPLIYRDASVPPHFTWKGIELLLASIRGETPLALRDRAMLILLCAYGLRGREVAQLTLEDIDWEHRLLKVRRKGGKVTTLPLMPVVEGTLSEYLTKSRPADAPYREILLTKYGLPFRQGCQTVRARLQTLVARAGLKRGRGVHAIRRAVGTRLVEQGWGAGAVAKIFDHESPDTVRIYLRLSLESLRDVAENYGNLL